MQDRTRDRRNAPRPTTETRAVTWSESTGGVGAHRRRRALFRRTAAGWRLQHVREVDVRQRGATTTTLDADVTLDDLPAWVPRRAGISTDTDTARRVAHA